MSDAAKFDEERLAAETVALLGTTPVFAEITREEYEALVTDVRTVVRSYAARCRNLDEEELTSFLMFEGGRALSRAVGLGEALWCEPAAYAGTAIRRCAGTYVVRTRSPATFTEWDLRKHYGDVVTLNQRASPTPMDGETVEEALGRLMARDQGAPDPSVEGLTEVALGRVRELVGACPVAHQVILGGQKASVVARESGLSAAQVRLTAAAAKTRVAHDGVVMGLMRLLGARLARDMSKPWTLACVAVGSGEDLPIDWPEPPTYHTPEEARSAAVRMERAYYARDPDATIEVEFVVRRARGVEAP